MADEIMQFGAQSERAFWVAFSQIPQIGPVRLIRLHQHFGSLAAAWEARDTELGAVIDSRTLDYVRTARAKTSPPELLEGLVRSGVGVVTMIDDDYPRLLAQIAAAPPVLYTRGKIVPGDELAIAMVGSRKSTAYGRQMACEISRELAAAGVTIVSGLAKGIDGSAHQGALEAEDALSRHGQRNRHYLSTGAPKPGERIAESGALISDYPPGTKPDAPNFPARNRLISGLSLGTVVIEAPKRSGALITVDFAADQGRDVFVVPANVGSAASEGSNHLLREGARAVTSASDILEDLGLSQLPIECEEPVQPVPVSDRERCLMAILGPDPQHIDEIVVAAE